MDSPVAGARKNSADHFINGHSLHTAKIDRAFAQEARAAFDLMAEHAVTRTERASKAWFGRTKDRDDGHAEHVARCIVPVSFVSSKLAFAQFGDESDRATFARSDCTH